MEYEMIPDTFSSPTRSSITTFRQSSVLVDQQLTTATGLLGVIADYLFANDNGL